MDTLYHMLLVYCKPPVFEISVHYATQINPHTNDMACLPIRNVQYTIQTAPEHTKRIKYNKVGTRKYSDVGDS